MNNASDLFGSTHISAGHTTGDAELDSLVGPNLRTKEDFEKFSEKIYRLLIKQHSGNSLFPGFIEHHTKLLCDTLRDVEIRKTAAGLTGLANQKQQDQRDKASGKKKSKLAAPKEPGAKAGSK